MARLRKKTVFLGDVAQSRDNNLNLLRFLAAAAVALSHSFLLVTGDPESRPLMKATGFSIGYHAVDIFFVISGFLVTQSWMRRNSLLDFTVARALRIYPALAVCVVLTARAAAAPEQNVRCRLLLVLRDVFLCDHDRQPYLTGRHIARHLPHDAGCQ